MPFDACRNEQVGNVFLYDRQTIESGPVQSLQMSIHSANGDFVGIPAYDPVTNYFYVEQPATFNIYRPGLAAFRISSDCTLDKTPAWAAAFGADGRGSGNNRLRSPITIANGVVYVSDYITAQTYAFNSATGTRLWKQTLSGGGIVGPVVAGGKLYEGSAGPSFTSWSP